MAPENDTTRPLLVELVGPAGVGKSALAERLTARSGVVRASVWNLPRSLLLESAARRLTTHERLDVMARYHVAFARVLDDVVAAGGPAPLKLAATEGSVEHLRDRVLAALGQPRHG